MSHQRHRLLAAASVAALVVVGLTMAVVLPGMRRAAAARDGRRTLAIAASVRLPPGATPVTPCAAEQRCYVVPDRSVARVTREMAASLLTAGATMVSSTCQPLRRTGRSACSTFTVVGTRRAQVLTRPAVDLSGGHVLTGTRIDIGVGPAG